MKNVGLVTQKGGPGKSTTGASLAVAAIERGFKVFLLELDRQGTWSAWIAARAYNGVENDIDFETIEASQLSAALATLDRAGYDLVILDTPGTENPAIYDVMRRCHLALIPCRPTAPDIQGCVPTVEALARMRTPLAFILTQCLPRSSRVEDFRARLSHRGVVAEPPIVSRVDHQDALALGLGVTEFNPIGAAAAEIRALWSWIETRLEMKLDAEA